MGGDGEGNEQRGKKRLAGWADAGFLIYRARLSVLDDAKVDLTAACRVDPKNSAL